MQDSLYGNDGIPSFDEYAKAPVSGSPANDDGIPSFDTYAKSNIKPVAPSRGLIDTAKDIGITGLKSAIGVPEAALGLADIATGGRAGKYAEEAGFRPKEAKDILETYYSPAQQAANANVRQAEGFVPTLKAYAQNPSVLAHDVGEQAFPILAGGVVGAGVGALAPNLAKAAPYLPGAVGEAGLTAGQNAEQVRQQTENGLLDTEHQTLPIVASSLVTGGIGALGGKLANELGFTDVQRLASGMGSGATNTGLKGLARNVAGTTAIESLEEGFQSPQEQVAQNYALDRPLSEGVGSATAQGLLLGGAMGGGTALVDPANYRKAPVQPEFEQAPLINQPQPSAFKQRPAGPLTRAAAQAQPIVSDVINEAPEADASTVINEATKRTQEANNAGPTQNDINQRGPDAGGLQGTAGPVAAGGSNGAADYPAATEPSPELKRQALKQRIADALSQTDADNKPVLQGRARAVMEQDAKLLDSDKLDADTTGKLERRIEKIKSRANNYGVVLTDESKGENEDVNPVLFRSDSDKGLRNTGLDISTKGENEDASNSRNRPESRLADTASPDVRPELAAAPVLPGDADNSPDSSTDAGAATGISTGYGGDSEEAIRKASAGELPAARPPLANNLNNLHTTGITNERINQEEITSAANADGKNTIPGKQKETLLTPESKDAFTPTHKLNDGYNTLVAQEDDGSYTTLDGKDNYTADNEAIPLTPDDIKAYHEQKAQAQDQEAKAEDQVSPGDIADETQTISKNVTQKETAPESSHTSNYLNEKYGSDYHFLTHQTDSNTANEILSSGNAFTNGAGTVGTTYYGTSETVRQQLDNVTGRGPNNHKGATGLVVMAVPKSWGRTHHDVDNTLSDNFLAGDKSYTHPTRSGVGVPNRYIVGVWSNGKFIENKGFVGYVDTQNDSTQALKTDSSAQQPASNADKTESGITQPVTPGQAEPVAAVVPAVDPKRFALISRSAKSYVDKVAQGLTPTAAETKSYNNVKTNGKGDLPNLLAQYEKQQNSQQEARTPEKTPQGEAPAAEASESDLIDHEFLKQDVNGPWKYRFANGSSWLTANSKEDAIAEATKAFNNTPKEERLTRQQRDEIAGNERNAKLEARYGKKSVPELENEVSRLDSEIQKFRKAGKREYDGMGSRRTSAAVSNEAARDLGAEKMALQGYIDRRKASDPPPQDALKQKIAAQREKSTLKPFNVQVDSETKSLKLKTPDAISRVNTEVRQRYEAQIKQDVSEGKVFTKTQLNDIADNEFEHLLDRDSLTELGYTKDMQDQLYAAKKEGKDDVKFSQATPTTGSTRETLINRLSAGDKRLLQSGRINIVQSVNDLPEHLQDAGKQQESVLNQLPVSKSQTERVQSFSDRVSAPSKYSGNIRATDAFIEKTDSIVDRILTLITGIDSALSERSGYTANADAGFEFLRNIAQSQPFLSHGYSGLDIKTRFKVLSSMRYGVSDLKVRNGVIKLIPIDVVNNLTPKKFTADMLLDDMPMSLNLSSVNPNDSIPLRINMAISSIIDAIAFRGTKEVPSFVSGNDANVFVERNTTSGTIDDRHVANSEKVGDVLGGKGADTSLSPSIISKLSNVQGIFDGKSIYLVADNLNPATLPGVLLHEKLHAAIASNPKLKERLLGSQSELQDIFNKTKSGSYSGRYKSIYDAAMRRVEKAGTKKSDALEEWISYNIELYNKPTANLPERLLKAIKDLAAVIKAAIFRYTGQIANISPADLSELAKSSMTIDSTKNKNYSQLKGVVMSSKVQSTEQYDSRFMDNDMTGLAERVKRVAYAEDEYRLPNLHDAVPADMVPRQARQKVVKIYRGVPTKYNNATIRPGDWVAIDKKYAAAHGTGETGRSHVITMDVAADDVVWAGTDMNEYFYAPKNMAKENERALDLLNRLGKEGFDNWTPSQSSPNLLASVKETKEQQEYDVKYPLSNGEVDGRLVLSDIPNRSSISASLDDYDILPGIREVSFDLFTQMGELGYSSKSERERTQNLAQEISNSKEIKPLIVVIDKEGPYVLEGGHRFDALRELKAKSFPALVVIDNDSINESNDIRYSVAEDNALSEFKRRAGLGPKKTLVQTIQDVLNRGIDANAQLVKDKWAELKPKIEQGVFDKFLGIKLAEKEIMGDVAHSLSGYIGARLSTGSSSTMSAVLQFGAPQWKDGIIQKKDGSKGFAEILQDVKDDLENFTAWMVARRADRLYAEGKENNFSREMIDAGLALKKGKYQKVADEIAALNASMLDLAQDSGLIDAESRKTWESADYIPFYRLIEEQKSAGPRSKQGLSHQSSGIRMLKGGENPMSDPLGNMMQNWAHLVDAAMKNSALDKTLTNLEGSHFVTSIPRVQFKQALIPKEQIKKLMLESGLPKEMVDLMPADITQGIAKMWAMQAPTDPDVVRVMRDGKSEYYRVNDPMLLTSLVAVNQSPLPGIFKPMRYMKSLLTGAVTADPTFMARNFIRDSLHSWTIAEEAGFKIGVDSIQGAIKSFKEEGGYIDMMFAGASFQGGYGNYNNPDASRKSMEAVLRKKGIRNVNGFMDSIIDTPKKYWEMYRGIGDAIENANREAILENAKRAGAEKAQYLFEAKDIMDFSMQGSFTLVRAMSDMLPFFNARLIGLYRLMKAGKTEEARRIILMKGASIAMFSLALLAMNAGNDDYEELEDFDKDQYWHIFVGDQHFRIPKPFELGLVFGTIPERSARALIGKDSLKEYAARLGHGASDTLAFNPVPQLFKPFVELYSNKDMFTGRPIEGMADEGKLPSARYNEYTSETMRTLSSVLPEALGASPKRLEHLMHGYTGAMGMYILGAADSLVRTLSGMPDEPTMRMDRIPVLKAFYQEKPALHTVYGTKFYDMLRQTEQIQRTINAYKKEGRVEDARMLQSENADKLRFRKQLNQSSKSLSETRKKIDMIYRSGISSEQKRERIDSLMKQSNKTIQAIVKKTHPYFS